MTPHRLLSAVLIVLAIVLAFVAGMLRQDQPYLGLALFALALAAVAAALWSRRNH